jgi:hypothetical protein
MYLFILFIGSGLYTFYKAEQGAYDKWITTAEGVVDRKYISEQQTYLEINKSPVAVGEETYKTTKVGEKVTLGRDKRDIGELRGFHMIISLFISAIALLIVAISWLIWLFCHSDSKTYLQYFRGK